MNYISSRLVTESKEYHCYANVVLFNSLFPVKWDRKVGVLSFFFSNPYIHIRLFAGKVFLYWCLMSVWTKVACRLISEHPLNYFVVFFISKQKCIYFCASKRVSWFLPKLHPGWTNISISTYYLVET